MPPNSALQKQRSVCHAQNTVYFANANSCAFRYKQQCVLMRLPSPFWPWNHLYHPQPRCQSSLLQNHLPVEKKNKQSRHLASSTNKLKTRESFLYGRYHRDTFLSLCIPQILLFCLLLILLAHHRRWDWLHKRIPLQQTLMVKNLLPLLLNLPFNRNI